MDDFAEDRLPRSQPPIITSNVRELLGFVELVRDPARTYPAIGTVTGDSGAGKTIAVQYYFSKLQLRPNTRLPAVVKVKVKPRSTPKAFSVDLTLAVHDRPKGQNVYQVADEAAAAIIRNDVELIIVDEADRLTAESFDILRHIHDKTGCPVVVVGLPELLTVIDSQEKFASRVALRMQFQHLELAEILDVVLPQMVFPHWKYSAESENDRRLGERIWRIVNHSFRNLRNLLQAADQDARFHGEDMITRETIDSVLKKTASDADIKRLKSPDAPTDPTSYEGESERRQYAKGKTTRL